ncbi:aminodeoxychorismate synthase component I [Roseibium aestuarii]|uniref:Probable branched-chain-amino-acid aminotransferase n=1 Tax=Roseibium aestuarii TaxID=2600299 RepID=A0ABW4JUG0_9HYPH|nr:aminodeoxychorismate synthase component I [Roseibium aestuarii]
MLQDNSVLLLDALGTRKGRLYTAPERILECRSLSDVPAFLADVEAARRAGGHLAGFLAYELGYAFEDKLRQLWQKREQVRTPGQDDLLGWFGVYGGFEEIDLATVERRLAPADPAPVHLSESLFDMDRAAYDEAFRQCQKHLACGDIYQVNFTLRARLSHEGLAESQFLALLRRQPVEHAAFIRLADRAILSLSPELFLERQGQTLRTRPMKGTAPRGRDSREDDRLARELAASEKQRAENIMIVDLMRNDLSRISHPGTVRVRNLCRVERYRSLHQMTTTVEGDLVEGVGFPQIIERLFPCGSITGAPKLSAMMIADRLETSPRGVYTGSIGCVEPSGDFRFNVAIRTLVLRSDGTGEIGTGSGVVHDSGAAPEYDECKLKLKFLHADSTPRFDLLETMAFDPQAGILLKERHLRRLADAAAYFAYPLDPGQVETALEAAIAEGTAPLRLRLTLSERGQVAVAASPLDPVRGDEVWPVAIAPEPIRADLRFRLHKTTNRAFYDEIRTQVAAVTGAREVLFLNEDGFLTEGSFTSLFVLRNGKLLTPALRHGLLPGTLRAALLESGRAMEADLRLEDLRMAERIYVGNSVRGLIPVRMVEA